MILENDFVFNNITLLNTNPTNASKWIKKFNLIGIDLFNFNGWLSSLIRDTLVTPVTREGKNIYIETKAYKITVTATNFKVISMSRK